MKWISKVMILFYKEMVVVLLNKKFKFIVIFGTLYRRAWNKVPSVIGE